MLSSKDTLRLMNTHRVKAYNTAHASENKIHDDDVARRFGFTGALVPGVEVYAYMMHLPVGRWGRAFLERGAAECRFASPVYDGEIAEMVGREEGDGMAIDVLSQGRRCATGSARLPAQSPQPPSLSGFERGDPPASDDRPPGDEQSLPLAGRLNSFPLCIDAAYAATYLEEVRETDGLYAREGLLHPGIVLRMCNKALLQTVKISPWIHVGSSVQNHGVAKVGETLTALGRIAANYEKKGHRFVEFDALVIAGEARPIASVRHTAIYRPRQAG